MLFPEQVSWLQDYNLRVSAKLFGVAIKGKVHIEGWYQDEALPKDWRIEVSPNGWTTDQIGLSWLQNIFIPATNGGHTTGIYHLLVLDGHGSHLTPQFKIEEHL